MKWKQALARYRKASRVSAVPESRAGVPGDFRAVNREHRGLTTG
jgi:hypothetical protein